ncbi:glycoside hydrolase family 47 protein [Dissoconium aciculare CBS 342.82]|uniref:alpha-1,2-Mannosidase n=1 Tax=Dissoconium aciculare CBS 342.82 TaxID=1314786 RepID=A0A6J3MLT4_9PEZI|nr:glycoside hydrolase family 47 protein [Dissoconium aciculare CBS 342.82]KAF1827947.1 glycoside hydrolase family 47 protein [Dissoconium aciculare CBS 342.82]
MPSQRPVRLFALLCIAALGWSFWPRSTAAPVDWDERRGEVKNAFLQSWTAYSAYAWGNDKFHPIAKTGSQMSPKGLGWIIVDSLDTLMIMNLTTELADARRWVARKLDYNQEQDVNTFETTIRMLGGLLSAHYLAGALPGTSSRRDNVYLTKAIDLADRLLGAYDSPSGVPYASIYLSSRKGIPSHDGGASSTAETTTLQIEMKYLSNLTGNEIYWRKAENVMRVVDGNRAKDGLLPIFIDPQSGRFTTSEIRLGSRGDSYYGRFRDHKIMQGQYLVKQYLHTAEQEPIYQDMWQEALEGIEKHLLIPTKKSKLTFVAELPYGIGGQLSPKMDHLVCFLPGTIALGATGGRTEAEARKLPTWTNKKEREMHIARELMKTCYGMYAVTATGLAPEITWFHATEKSLQPNSGPARPLPRSSDSVKDWLEDYEIRPLDAHNLQRPETVESLFLMWRITQDPIYREWGWTIFRAFQEHTRLLDGEGFTSLQDVRQVPPPRRDNMESFWLAETLKYLYLLFSPDDLLPLTEVVFNTEAHVLPVLRQTQFTTGWQRTPR